MISQKERAEVLKNDQASTLHQFGTSEANEIGGRHAAINKSTVVGATPSPQYPAQPEGSWCNQDALVPDEPPLAYPIDQQEAVGTAQEIQASLDDPERANADSHQLISDPSAAPSSSGAPARASSREAGAPSQSPRQSREPRRPQFIRP
jgi:hypothetical protein